MIQGGSPPPFVTASAKPQVDKTAK
jgi:hypothetical protein